LVYVIAATKVESRSVQDTDICGYEMISGWSPIPSESRVSWLQWC